MSFRRRSEKQDVLFLSASNSSQFLFDTTARSFRLLAYADVNILPQAFIVASTSSEEDMLQFYKDHVVWSKEEIESLVSKGLFGRLYTPQVSGWQSLCSLRDGRISRQH
jgi:hypothetical protein